MKLIIEISLDNDTMRSNAYNEIAVNLDRVVAHLFSVGLPNAGETIDLTDYNGNSIGFATVVE